MNLKQKSQAHPKGLAEIVKVEVKSIENVGLTVLQVTNEDDSLHWVGSPGESIRKLLGERDLAYFYAKVEDRKLKLGQEAPQQRW